MNIAVIAANGRSGQAFVEAALAAGHNVRAGVRGESHLKPHPRMTVVACDATNTEQLSSLLMGQEAVASFIGHVKGSDPNVQTIAIQKLIEAMHGCNIKRLVSLTGTGVRFSDDKITLVDRFLNLSISIIDPARVRDGKNHVQLLMESDLEWTVIRVLKLQNTSSRPFTLREHGPTKSYVAREEVAQAVLQVLEERSFIKRAPIIGKQD